MNPLIFIDNWFENLPKRRKARQKSELRAVLAQRRKVLPKEVVAAASADVVAQIVALPAFQAARTVMIYYPIHNEIDLRALLEQASEKQYLFPITHRDYMEVRPYAGEANMRKGKFGIPEPTTDTFRGKIDLILVPGVAFDKKHRRMGRGGGYYDKFLRRQPYATKIGVGYAFQVVPYVPTDWRDVKMDSLVIAAE